MEHSISSLEIPRNICGLHRTVHITGKPYTLPKGKVPEPAVVHVYYRRLTTSRSIHCVSTLNLQICIGLLCGQAQNSKVKRNPPFATISTPAQLLPKHILRAHVPLFPPLSVAAYIVKANQKHTPASQNRLTGVCLIRFRTGAAGCGTRYAINKAHPPRLNRISPPAENRRPPPSGPSRPSSGTGCSPGQNCPGPPRYTPARRRSS